MPTLEENLNKVIKALEWMQENNYSSIRGITLSYLYDIRDNKVPVNLLTNWDESIQ